MKEERVDIENKYALLIDADNISPKYLDTILSEAKEFGSVSIRRIYGDWTENAKSSWKDVLLENSITPIQQYTYTFGKNSSDSAMIIDAMDILYGNQVEGFILASSDSDFTRLAMRLRESGKDIIGMGESKTPAPFVRACRAFKTLDVLYKASRPNVERKKGNNTRSEESEISPITSIRMIQDYIVNQIDIRADESGELYLSELGNSILKEYPDFDCRNYGYKKLIELVEHCDKLALRSEKSPNGAKLVYVRLNCYV